MIWLNALKEHRLGYEDYKEYLERRIKDTSVMFMSTTNFEDVLKIKGHIEALQTLLLETTADEREEQALHGR